MAQGKGIFGWVDTVKALLRYGYKSPTKADSLCVLIPLLCSLPSLTHLFLRVKDLVKKFLTFYEPSAHSWANVSDVAAELGWSSLLAQTAAHYYDSQGISQLFSREIIEAATRVNYGQVRTFYASFEPACNNQSSYFQSLQNLDRIHAIEGTVSMAATGASAVKGGNFQIFERFLAHSGAKVYLNTTVRVIPRLLKLHLTSLKVTSLTEKADHWVLKTADGESKHYNDIILAAPYHQSGIKVSLASSLLSLSPAPEVPEQPYVHLHVTLLTTTAPHPDPEYFGLKPGSKVPNSILTTYEGARNGGPIPEFNSLTYHGKVSPDRDEYVVKIFSSETITDEWLNKVFGGKVGWVHRKLVRTFYLLLSIFDMFADLFLLNSGKHIPSFLLPTPSRLSFWLPDCTTSTPSSRAYRVSALLSLFKV